MKIITLICFLSISITAICQERITATYGVPTEQELNMDSYPKDPEAAGVVLFDKGHYSVEEINGQLRLVKKVHTKIKVLNAKKFESGDIEIPYYIGENLSEKVTEIKAMTNTKGLKKAVSPNEIFTVDNNPNWKSKKFTFPDIKDGSILEYTYRIESPYFFNLGGWAFQSELPTLYSEFHTEIPGNFKYNKAVFGFHKLALNESAVKKNCLYFSYTNQSADCETGLYTMQNVPAFKEEEYMLSRKNYISRIGYELKEFYMFNGDVERYSKSWEDVDKELKFDDDLGRQLKLANYFEKNLPAHIEEMPVNKEKAAAIYNYIRDHFMWNKSYRSLSDIEVKEAFKEKKGNSGEINLALINALNAGGFEAHPVLSSTRQNGLPTPLYPVITEFNYVFAALIFNSETILLDATRKNAPFGIIPFELLNEKGRLMDFKRESKWIPIIAYNDNSQIIQAQFMVADDGSFNGKARENYKGYLAYNEREDISNNTEKVYFKSKESSNENTELNNFSIKNKDVADKTLSINYDISIVPEMVGDKVIFNPFFFEPTFEKNPFNLDVRNFPVDFGYPLKTAFNITLDLKDKYTVVEMPEDVSISLPNDQGNLIFQSVQSKNSIQMRYVLSINKTSYSPDDYEVLKQFFKQIIKTQSQNYLLLKEVK